VSAPLPEPALLAAFVAASFVLAVARLGVAAALGGSRRAD